MPITKSDATNRITFSAGDITKSDATNRITFDGYTIAKSDFQNEITFTEILTQDMFSFSDYPQISSGSWYAGGTEPVVIYNDALNSSDDRITTNIITNRQNENVWIRSGINLRDFGDLIIMPTARVGPIASDTVNAFWYNVLDTNFESTLNSLNPQGVGDPLEGDPVQIGNTYLAPYPATTQLDVRIYLGKDIFNNLLFSFSTRFAAAASIFRFIAIDN